MASPLDVTHELCVSPEHLASNGFTKLPSGWKLTFRRLFISPYSGVFWSEFCVSPVHVPSSNLDMIHTDFPIFMKRHYEKRATFWKIFLITLHFQLLEVSARVHSEVRGGLSANITKHYWRRGMGDLRFARLCWWWLCRSSDVSRRVYQYIVTDVSEDLAACLSHFKEPNKTNIFFSKRSPKCLLLRLKACLANKSVVVG